MKLNPSSKRFYAVAAILFSIVWMAGCSTLPKNFSDSPLPSSSAAETSSATSEAKNSAFTLGYSSGDSLNPYKAATRNNLQLSTLLYEGLTKIDDKMTPQMNLAASVDTSNPWLLTAVIRSDARFSDGSKVSASDVVASFNTAKSSAYYKALLNDIKSANASGSNTVIFQLNSLNPDALACLSFPVVKSGTDIGSGRYVYQSGDSPVLNANPHNGAKPTITEIHLLDLPDSDSMLYGLESGSISIFFDDLSTGEIPRTSSATINVPLNYMVFLGVNESRSQLSNASVRQALSAAANRSEICANAFAGRATVSVSPFNPSWGAAADLKGFSENDTIADAVADLEQAGYNSSNGKTLSLELLVCNDNNNSFHDTAATLLSQQLGKAGIKLTVTKLSYSDYCDRLNKGNFDLYLGEIRLPADMSLQPLLQGGSASYGISKSDSAVQAYTQYLSGSMTLQQFTDTFNADLPFIPLCWQEGLTAYNRALSNVTPTAFDAFYGIDSWIFSNS